MTELPEDGSPDASLQVAPDASPLAAPIPFEGEGPGASLPSDPATARWHPSYVFLGALSLLTLAADLSSKWWAEHRLDGPDALLRPVELVKGHLGFVLAHNKGGAWGLLQGTAEAIRKPFFVIVSILAIVFIVSLYRRLAPTQAALRWGLPLVLGGALGNLIDRIRYSWVIDFIDYRATWVRWMNSLFSKTPSDHWPTFNVADIAICVGVGLMAIDMLSTRRAPAPPPPAPTAT